MKKVLDIFKIHKRYNLFIFLFVLFAVGMQNSVVWGIDGSEAYIMVEKPSGGVQAGSNVAAEGMARAAGADELADKIKENTTIEYESNPMLEQIPCTPLKYYKNLKGCWLCSLFGIVFDTSSKVTNLAISRLSGSVFTAVLVAFAAWLSLQVLMFVSSIEKRDIKDLFKAIFKQSFIVAIVTILLNTNLSSFFKTALEPIFSTSVNVAQAAISISGTKDVAQPQSCSKSGGNAKADFSTGALPESMKNGILCVMEMVQNQAAAVTALGSASICQSFEEWAWFVPHLGYLLVGLGLWIGGMVLIIAVPFVMIDYVAELAIAGGLLPVAVGAFAFKPTRGYSIKIWQTFLHSAFSFMFVAVLVLMLTTAYIQVLDSSYKPANGAKLSSLILSADFNIAAFTSQMHWWSSAFLKVVFALMLAWTMMGKAGELAGDFSGGKIGTEGIGSSIGAMGASAAKGAAGKVGKLSWSAAKSVGTEVGQAGRRAVFNRQVAKAQRLGTATRNADGSTTYTRTSRTLLGRTKTTNVTIGADGTASLKSVKSSKSGKKQWVKEKDKNISVSHKERKGKDGTMHRVGSETVRFNSNAVNKLVKKDGTINTAAFNQMMTSSTGDAQKMAIMKNVMERQVPGSGGRISNQALLKDASGKVVGYRATMKDGSIQEMGFSTKQVIGKNGKVSDKTMLNFTTLDKNGKKAQTITTDGIIRKTETFDASRSSDGSISINGPAKKTSYILNGANQKYMEDRRFHKISLSDSAFSSEERSAAIAFVTKGRGFAARKILQNDANRSSLLQQNAAPALSQKQSAAPVAVTKQQALNLLTGAKQMSKGEFRKLQETNEFKALDKDRRDILTNINRYKNQIGGNTSKSKASDLNARIINQDNKFRHLTNNND